MKRVGKWLLGLVGLLVVAAGLFVAYFFVRYPDVAAAEDVKVAATPERLARGQYLVENVVGCVVCHADRDFARYTGPVVEGTKGKGGQRFGFGLEPFVMYAKNITPGGHRRVDRRRADPGDHRRRQPRRHAALPADAVPALREDGP